LRTRRAASCLHFLVDEKGNKTSVVLDIKEYEELLERAEDTEALRMLQKMRKAKLECRKFDEVLNEHA